LRREIVGPPLLQPQPRIGIQPVISIKALDLIGVARPTDPKGADAYFNQRLGRFSLVVKPMNKIIDIRLSARVADGWLESTIGWGMNPSR
jgi:hypothetical protein